MFGGVLSKLLGKSTSKVASNKSGDLLSRVMANNGDEIARSLSANYGDDTSRSILGSLLEAPAAAPTRSGTSLVTQLRNGVDRPASINPNIAENFAVEGATNKALTSNKGAAAKVRNFGKSVEDAGTKLKNNSIMGTIRDKKVLERAPDSIKWAEKYGLSTNQYEDVSKILTGDEGILSNFNSNALRNAKRSIIMPDSARQNALKAVDNAISLEPHSKKTLKRIINDSYDVTTGNIGNRLAERGEARAAVMGEADIFDMHKTVQKLEKIAYEQTGKDADEIQKILRPYANELKGSINDAAKEIYRNADNIQELTSALQGANLSPQLNKDIIDAIRNGTDYLGIRALQSPAVTLGKIAEAERLAPLAGGIASGGNQMFSNPLLQVANEVVGKPVAKATGKALEMGGRATQAAAGGGGGAGVPPIIKYGAAGLGGYGILNMLTNNGGGDVNPSIMAAAGMTDQDTTGDILNGAAAAQSTATVAGYNRSQLENAYLAALMDDNPEAAEAIATMIDMLDNTEKRIADAEGSSKDNAKAQNAITAMNNLMAVYEQGGGAQGPLGALSGLLNKATFGTLNPNQAAYEDMLQAAAVAVARANGEVGVLSNQDIENYRKMLPTFSDNPQQAQIKLQTIMSGLQSQE